MMDANIRRLLKDVEGESATIDAAWALHGVLSTGPRTLEAINAVTCSRALLS